MHWPSQIQRNYPCNETAVCGIKFRSYLAPNKLWLWTAIVFFVVSKDRLMTNYRKNEARESPFVHIVPTPLISNFDLMVCKKRKRQKIFKISHTVFYTTKRIRYCPIRELIKSVINEPLTKSKHRSQTNFYYIQNLMSIY